MTSSEMRGSVPKSVGLGRMIAKHKFKKALQEPLERGLLCHEDAQFETTKDLMGKYRVFNLTTNGPKEVDFVEWA